MWIAVGLGVLVVAGLTAYAVWLWLRVWRRERAARARYDEARTDRRQSIRILARAVVDDELNLTEGAIRLKVLLDHELPPDAGGRRYPGLYGLHDATRHMPRRLERRRYPAAEIERLDAEREALEACYRESVMAEAGRLLAAAEDGAGGDWLRRSLH